MSRHACVVVLGDIGRSPRMCNHAMSLAEEGYHVDLIGYGGSSVGQQLSKEEKIKISQMAQFPTFFAFLPKLAVYALKVVWQTILLLWALPWIVISKPPEFVILQNPPSIPSLAVCIFYCKFLRLNATKLVVDWHNYGYTILSLAHSGNLKHPVVRFSHWIESTLGKRAEAGFCVTNAMKHDLSSKWNVEAVTLYDKAPEKFCAISDVEKHELFLRLGEKYSSFLDENKSRNRTRFTRETGQGHVKMLEDRPGVIVSSTSWTEDEDFSVLLEALSKYEENSFSSELPPLLCVITGKGPLKEHYKQLIERQEWQHVTVVMPWLEPDDYPRMLACADLGISLHTSSSGLDLPMKVVDMFGCGLPVAAIDFKALPELLRHGENGSVFSNADELAEQIEDWFRGFPNQGEEKRKKMKENVLEFNQIRWREYWKKTALPVLQNLASK